MTMPSEMSARGRPSRSLRRFRRGISIAVCLLALQAATMSALVVVPAEFGEMVAGSQLVVHGRVLDVRSFETAGRRTIESLVTVQVVTAIKGEPGDTVVFRVPGGQVGRYRRVMVGAPQFVPRDEVVVFLAGRAPVVPMPFGLTQGVYRVQRDAGGRAMVTPLVTAGAGRVVRGDPARRPLDLAAFKSLVQGLAAPRP